MFERQDSDLDGVGRPRIGILCHNSVGQDSNPDGVGRHRIGMLCHIKAQRKAA